MNKLVDYTESYICPTLLRNLQIALSAYNEILEDAWVDDFVEYDINDAITKQEIMNDFTVICELTRTFHEKLVKLL